MNDDILLELRALVGRWLSMPLSAHQDVARVDLSLRQSLDNLFVLLDERHPEWYTDWCRANGHDPTGGPLHPAPTSTGAYLAAMRSPMTRYRWLQGMRRRQITNPPEDLPPGGGRSPE